MGRFLFDATTCPHVHLIPVYTPVVVLCGASVRSSAGAHPDLCVILHGPTRYQSHIIQFHLTICTVFTSHPTSHTLFLTSFRFPSLLFRPLPPYVSHPLPPPLSQVSPPTPPRTTTTSPVSPRIKKRIHHRHDRSDPAPPSPSPRPCPLLPRPHPPTSSTLSSTLSATAASTTRPDLRPPPTPIRDPCPVTLNQLPNQNHRKKRTPCPSKVSVSVTWKTTTITRHHHHALHPPTLTTPPPRPRHCDTSGEVPASPGPGATDRSGRG